MSNKIPVLKALERASQLAYSLENALRAGKADVNYAIDQVHKIKNLVKTAEERVNLEHEG